VIIRLRSAPIAGVVALLFVLTIAGLAAANTILNPTIVNKTPTTTSTLTTTPTTPTTTAFIDANGNGIADTCEQNVVADPTKAAAEQAAVDLDHDGTISVSEAARSSRTGGKNCNHGGYVSSVANGTDEQSETTDEAAPTTDCVPVPLPVRDPSLDGQKNAHGKWISSVAQSGATGGKNCNHGGAVSDASKADNAARKAARDAAKNAQQHGQSPNH